MSVTGHADRKKRTESLPRVTARLSQEDHALIERAAQLKGFSSVNSFMVTNIVELSKTIIERYEHIVLSERDAQALADAIDRPVRDLPKLKKLFGN